MPDNDSKDVAPPATAEAPARVKGAPTRAPEGLVMKPLEHWAKAKGVEAHWLAAAAFTQRWAVASEWGHGQEVSEADFDAAIEAVKTIEVR